MPTESFRCSIGSNEWCEDFTCPTEKNWQFVAKNFAESCVHRTNTKVHKSKPQNVTVSVALLGVSKGKLFVRREWKWDFPLPLIPTTGEEHIKEMEELLCDIPEEFKGYIMQEAWDRGHSAGYDEVYNIAGNMYSQLKPRITNYTKRIVGM